MKFEEQQKIDEDVFNRVRSIRETKGKEYATEEDTLADFKEVAAETGVSPLQVWNVYVKKHVRAIDTFIREGNVKSEAIYDRVLDVIVYHHLLLGLIEDLEKQQIGPDDLYIGPGKMTIHEHQAGVRPPAGPGSPLGGQSNIPLAHQGPPQTPDLGQHEDITDADLSR